MGAVFRMSRYARLLLVLLSLPALLGVCTNSSDDFKNMSLILAPGTAECTPRFKALAAADGVGVQDMDYASVRIYRDGTLYQIPLNDLYSNAGLQRTRLIEGDSVFVDTDYKLDRAEAYFSQLISLANTRLNGRERALNELTEEIQLRRADLGEARDNYDSRLESIH